MNVNSFERLRDQCTGSFGKPAPPSLIDEIEQRFSPFVFTEELREMYSVFDGLELGLGNGLLSLSCTIEARSDLERQFARTGEVFPAALFPLADLDGCYCFTTLSKNMSATAPVLSFALSDGADELYLEYESIYRMAETVLEQTRIASVNQYPGAKGHYVDQEALEAAQPSLNPNMYRLDQKGNFSSAGIQNVFGMARPPAQWLL